MNASGCGGCGGDCDHDDVVFVVVVASVVFVHNEDVLWIPLY